MWSLALEFGHARPSRQHDWPRAGTGSLALAHARTSCTVQPQPRGPRLPTSHGARRIHMRLTSRGASCRHGSGPKSGVLQIEGPLTERQRRRPRPALLSGLATGMQGAIRPTRMVNMTLILLVILEEHDGEES